MPATAAMFRNKFVLRVEPAFSSFLLRRITVSLPAPASAFLQSVCWRLSRSLRLACISQPPHIFVVYQGCQSNSAELAISELSQSIPVCDVSAVEEAASGFSVSLIAKAVDCALRAFMMDERNWSFLGDGCLVHSDFGCNEERIYLHALHLEVRADINTSFTFLVSPDVIHFKRYKVSNLIASDVLEAYNNGEEIVVGDSIYERSCSVLPSFSQGHIIGLKKSIPDGREFEHTAQLWSNKHGLAIPSECFMKIWFKEGGAATLQWCPSAFILHGNGLIPAPQSVRVPKANETLVLFLKILEDWDFFGGTPLKIKGVCRLPISPQLPGWGKATNNNILSTEMSENDASLSKYNNKKVSSIFSQLSGIDFRTPKPAIGTHYFGDSFDQPFVKENDIKSGTSISTHELRRLAVSQANTLKLKPIFTSHAHARRKSFSDPSVNFKPNSEKQANDKALTNNISDSLPSKDRPQEVVNKSSPLCLKVPRKETIGQAMTKKRTEQQADLLDNTAKVNFASGFDSTVTKKQTKLQADPSDVTAKVIVCHAKGQLGTLSVPELKCYLATKKAKLSGRKED